MSRIYVAGKFEDVDRVRAVQEVLREAGHTITLDWTRDDDGFTAVQAYRDLLAVQKAEILVFVAYEKLQFKGAYVEMGAALILGKPVYVLGDGIDECLFTMLPQVHRGIHDLLAPATLQRQRHLAINRGQLDINALKP